MTMCATRKCFLGEVIDAIKPDLEAFTSLWTALRVNYEGTNITRTVARLLHMYQPEEGVIAYERLLRTLFVLLEDFDSDGLQLLVSMVPPPKNASEEIVKEVFNRATGFVRVDAPIFYKNTDMIIAAQSNPEFPYPMPERQSCLSTTTQKKSEDVFSPEHELATDSNNPNPMSQIDDTSSENRMQKSPQIISQESSEVFRGFAPSEISNTQSHVQNIKNFYRPSTSYGFGQARTGRSFINFGQIVGQNSGQLQQQISSGSGLTAASAGYSRPKWFQNPYLIKKNSYAPISVAQYQDFYLKTVDNQFVKVPASKVNNFHQASVNTLQGSYQTLYNNPHDYLRNRSDTVTSGLLEKIQQHRSLQEAAMKKILTKCGPSKNSTILSGDVVSSSQASVGFKIVDFELNSGEQEETKISENSCLKKSDVDSMNGENLMMKMYDVREKSSASRNKKNTTTGNGEDISIAPGSESESNVKNHSLNSENFEEFTKEVRMRQRAIQEDIYKMDVVRNEEILEDDVTGIKEGADNLKEPEILTSSETLRNSCKNFMDRSKSGKIIEVPIFPTTRALIDIPEHSSRVLNPFESNLWRLLTSKNDSGNKREKIDQNDEQSHQESSGFSAIHQGLSVTPVEIIPDNNKNLSSKLSNSDPKRIVCRKKAEVSSTTRGRSQKVVQKGSTITDTASFHDESNLLDRGPPARPAEQDVQRMQINLQTHTMSRCPSSIDQQTNSASIGPGTTMAELAAYKKQYYDALLSIQKAKAAVANSLAISSMGSSPGFDPYYYNYLQHQHRQILQRRQQQIFMGQRFSQQQSLPRAPGGTPWFRNPVNWRYPVITPPRLSQRPQMLHPSSSSSSFSMWPPGVGYLGRESQNNTIAPQRQQLNVLQVSKPPIKRRKLEEIVGKLKETESNGPNT